MKNLLLKPIIAACLLLFSTIIAADNGYEIKIKITDYDRDTLFLAYPILDKILLKDTAILDRKSGYFVFKGEKQLESGVYILVIPPATLHLEMTICATEQHFTIVTQKDEPHNKIHLKNSIDNDIFFKYVHFIAEKGQAAEAARALKTVDSVASLQKFQALDKEVKTYRQRLIQKYPNTVAAMLIKSTIDIDAPQFDTSLTKNERDLANYYYYKKHHFDNFEVQNPAMLRTSVLFPKVDAYFERLTPQHPDSIIASLDYVLGLMKPSKETFQFYFDHYFRKYLQSNYVGYDAIWVHLAKTYIETGVCKGLYSVQDSARLTQKATKTLPLLIGKRAPNFKIYNQEGVSSEMYDVKAAYTILYFYKTDCGHCNKQSPILVEFFKKAKAKNIDVQVVSFCTKIGEEADKCWEYVKEKGFGTFINTAHPTHSVYAMSQYNIESTPTIFVLDKDKTIRMKNVSAEQLDDILDRIILEEKH